MSLLDATRLISDVFLLTEVRFKNNGLDLIEVQDNGSGISPDNYENVGKCDITYTVAIGICFCCLKFEPPDSPTAPSSETLYLQIILIR